MEVDFEDAPKCSYSTSVTNATQSLKQDASRLLQQFFGHNSFKPLQWNVVRQCVEERRDQLVVMSTGYGKSICYQIPALLSTGSVSVVVSPLVSLMHDQVLRLKAQGISALLFGSSQPIAVSVAKHEIVSGLHRVVYMTPEFVLSQGMKLLLEIKQTRQIAVVAVDEAHCISQWGHDFRHSYRSLGRLRDALHDVPFMALTATATSAVQRDIIASLHFRNCITTTTALDRPNLFLRVLDKKGSVEQDLLPLLKTSINGTKTSFGGSAIVYCATKAIAESVNEALNALGVASMLYHAGLSVSKRKEAHRAFCEDKLSTIVATAAFGLGIDKADIRHIIHYGSPRDVESYYQEIGRAGRDGLPSWCTVLYRRADMQIYNHFWNDNTSTSLQDHKMEMMRLMDGYLETGKCRRRFLLSLLQQESAVPIGDSAVCCDNCTREGSASSPLSELRTSQFEDFGNEARMLFEIYHGRSGFGKPIGFVRATAAAKVPDYHKIHHLYGAGKHRSEKWWKAFCQLLRLRGYIKESKVPPQQTKDKRYFGHVVVSLSTLAQAWYTGTASSLMLEPNREMEESNAKPRRVKRSTVQTTRDNSSGNLEPLHQKQREFRSLTYYGVHNRRNRPGATREDVLSFHLQRKLEQLRRDLCRENDELTHAVVRNDVLAQLSRIRPSNVQALCSNIEGLSPQQIAQYGNRLVECICDFCRSTGLATDCVEGSSTCGIEMLPSEMLMRYESLPSTARDIYFQIAFDGTSVSQLATDEGLDETAVVTHLCSAIKVGLPVDLESACALTANKAQIITRTIINSSGRDTLSDLTHSGTSDVTVAQQHVVQAIIQFEYGDSV